MSPLQATAGLSAILRASKDIQSVWFEGGEIYVSVYPQAFAASASLVPAEYQGYRVSRVEYPQRRPSDPLVQAIEAATDKVQSIKAVQVALIEGEQAKQELRRLRMSRFGTIGDRLKAKREDREKWAEAQHAKLDAVDAREPDIRAATEQHIRDEVEGELAAQEDELRRLSNSLPLVKSGN